MTSSTTAPLPPRPYESHLHVSSDIDRQYRYWRFRILATTMVGYAIYYFVRTNISVALKPMGDDLGYSKERLGIILTFGGITYGVSKFVNGFLGDRANPRYFMAVGLFASAMMNVFFGFSSALLFLTTFWLMNNWASGRTPTNRKLPTTRTRPLPDDFSLSRRAR